MKGRDFINPRGTLAKMASDKYIPSEEFIRYVLDKGYVTPSNGRWYIQWAEVEKEWPKTTNSVEVSEV